ncbi:S8 family peptidase [Actinoplanes sp. NPDC051861]|uniref:S8 family peptidase n=1 Tax=Actinoplanes sp. NPDC051861 TaxID=3155170 RepID=UPI003415F431
MRRRFLTNGITVTTAAAMGAFALPTGSQAFAPVSHGVALPAVVSAAQPVRVVTTTRDATGRPVVSVRTATTKARAADLVAIAAAAAGTTSVQVDVPVRALSDPYREDQWDLDTMGVDTAWETSTGDGVVVAVIDSGVDAEHPDLAGQVLPGFDTIDDVEGGGTDDNGHGTHVAGTVAAIAGNDEGVAGIAPDARILPVKALDADGAGWMSDTAEGIVWAADNGAQVINLSLGAPERSEAVSEAIGYARNRGVTVIAAAGNEREEGSPTSWPAADEGVIAVAATDENDEYGEYSNAGDYVDVAAPGSDIVSTYPGGDYDTMSGTSMAAPHVAAVAALLLGRDPDLSPDQIEDVLKDTAVDLGEDGFDADYGYGRVDAAAALAAEPGDGDPDGPGELVEPEIDVEEPSAPVAYGTRTVTGFTVFVNGDPLASQTVQACVSAGGGAWSCDDAETDASGAVEVPWAAKGAFRVRLDVPETEISTEASATVEYAVKAVVKVARAGKGAITVKVAGAAGQRMTVQRYQNKSWKTVKTFSATTSRKVTGLVAGGTYRVVLASTKTVQGVTSGTVKA